MTAQVDDDTVIALLRQLTVETDRLAEIFGNAHGMNHTDLDALATIMDASRSGTLLGPSELAEHLNLSTSAVTTVLDRLESAGHVHRVKHTTDRRRVVLQVHDQALALGREFFGPLGAEIGAVLAGFDAPQRATIARFLAASIDAVVRVRSAVPR